MARINRLQIHRFPNVAPDTTLQFSPVFNVLLGRSGSGNDVLLRLLGAVTCADFSDLQGEIFDVSCTMLTNKGELVLRIHRDTPDAAVYIEHDDTSHTIDEVDDQRSLMTEVFAHGWSLLPGLTAPDGADGAVRDPRWVPDPVLLHGLRAGAGPVEVDVKYIPELTTLWYHLDYEKAWVSCEHVSQAGVGRLGFRFRLSDDKHIGLDELNAEQQELLSLFYYVACRRDVAFLHQKLETIGEEAAGDLLKSLLHRQTFVTNTGSRLLYQLSFRSADAMQNACVLCKRDDQGRFVWKNMTPKESGKLFQFYDAGLKHLEDLARLW